MYIYSRSNKNKRMRISVRDAVFFRREANSTDYFVRPSDKKISLLSAFGKIKN